MKAGYTNRDEVRADIESGALHPFRLVHDYGRYADRDVRKWLGLRTWEEQWGNVPFSVISNYPESVTCRGGMAGKALAPRARQPTRVLS